MRLPKFVKSPLTGKDAPLVRGIQSSRLVNGYRQSYGYDAIHYFKDLPTIGLYQCDTGYCFYYPFSIAGDESLYRCLERFDWNYKQNKWEYDAALPFIQNGDKILDVGCGEGNFLVKARTRGAVVSGIELNRQAAQIARAKVFTFTKSFWIPTNPVTNMMSSLASKSWSMWLIHFPLSSRASKCFAPAGLL